MVVATGTCNIDPLRTLRYADSWCARQGLRLCLDGKYGTEQKMRYGKEATRVLAKFNAMFPLLTKFDATFPPRGVEYE